MPAILFLILSLFTVAVSAQTVDQNLSKSWEILNNDPQMAHAIAGITVINTSTGKLVFEKNGQIGLAPASTQKIITSVAFYELLGKEFRYKTVFGYSGRRIRDSLDGYLFFRGSGDPSLGSNRFRETAPLAIFNKWVSVIKGEGIKKLSNEFFIDESMFESMHLPGGWIVDDIGNYYGAGARRFNWRENQYDISLESGKTIGDPVTIKELNGQTEFYRTFHNELKTAEKGSGDNAYIYLPLEGTGYHLRGTIPVGEKRFVISGAVVDPGDYMIDSFKTFLQGATLLQPPDVLQFSRIITMSGSETVLDTYLSPSFDSLNYQFLHKSINLYGEAFMKTIALEKDGYGSTEKGIAVIKNLYKAAGIDPDAISIVDGSGLSPQNRVTTNAMATILQMARKKTWFSSFQHSLPEFNQMKMKSGFISGVRAFAGYHTSAKGVQYCYSVMVNNFTGTSAEITKKIYKLLDNLK